MARETNKNLSFIVSSCQVWLFRTGRPPVHSRLEAMRVAARTVAVELLLPLHHIAVAAVFRDQLVHLIAAFARGPAAFDAQHIELAFDAAEYEVGLMARAYSITSSASC